jgi:hypothetical protein
LPNDTQTAEKILSRLKGLRSHLQDGEMALASIPAIWDSGREGHSTACDVVLTNQRLLGYYFVSFPRERLFLEAVQLASITGVSLRQKTFEPVFRELMVSDGQRRVYIRAPRQKIETLYEALRSAIERYAPDAEAAIETEQDSEPARSAPVYGRQDIRAPFENSFLAIILLFVGGLVLEIGGVLLWAALHSSQAGLPLCIAGFIAVLTAILLRRQRSS